MSNTGLLTKDDVSKILNVSDRKVLEMARRGILRSLKVGKDVRFERGDIEGFIENKRRIRSRELSK